MSTRKTIMATLFALVPAILMTGVAAAQDKPAPAAKDGEAFLAENKTKDGVVTLPSGLQYRILKAGTGKKPTIEDSVVCQFRGTHIDGTEFVSSYTRKKPTIVALKRSIKGWAEALQLMPVGSKWQLFVPAHLAYGARGVRGRVPPNAPVIFEVELTAIASTPAEAAELRALKSIEVAFKLDPRLTQGLYMGERWVSPPTYNRVGTPTSVTVEARAAGVDARGLSKAIAPTWAPADPGLVTVTPAQGSSVTITVHRVGETTLTITAEGVSKKLTVKSRHASEVLQVEITQEKSSTN